MQASFENGVLEITIPKKEAEKPQVREIPISGAQLN
jgi:HSP20 family molecular chaperone IbpA